MGTYYMDEDFDSLVEAYEEVVSEETLADLRAAMKKLDDRIRGEKYLQSRGESSYIGKEGMDKLYKRKYALQDKIKAARKNEETMDEFFVGVRDQHMKDLESDRGNRLARKLAKERKEKKAKKEKDDVKAKAKAKKHGKATRAKAKEKSSGMTAAQLNTAIANAQKRIKVKNKKMKSETNPNLKKTLQQAVTRDKHKITAWRGLLRKASKNEGYIKMSPETRKVSNAYEVMLNELEISELGKAVEKTPAFKKLRQKLSNAREQLRKYEKEKWNHEKGTSRRNDLEKTIKSTKERVSKLQKEILAAHR